MRSKWLLLQESQRWSLTLKFNGWEIWSKDVKSHPALRTLPAEIQNRLVVDQGLWSTLPLNKRLRKKAQRDGLIVHLFAGEEEGFTLKRAFQQQGGDPESLLEIDVKRGERHDMLSDNGVYSGLIRGALENKIKAFVGGPNCRSRSVLRHFPIPGRDDAPRPLRAWGGQEFGLHDLTPEERLIVSEDDILLWRMVFLYLVATYMAQARQLPDQVGFLLEQPASPHEYVPETVSFWRTDQWKALKTEMGFWETTYQQGRLGGAVPKPTTFGGNLRLNVEKHRMKKCSSKGEIKSSKDLARWSPGTMSMVAESLLTQVIQQTPKLRPLSWEEHIRYGHVPYRRDCAICQQAMQQQAPHRKIQNPKGGILSVDVAGPLKRASDLGGLKARYLLVAALTWKVPKGSDKLKEEEVGELEEGAPVIDDPDRRFRQPAEEAEEEVEAIEDERGVEEEGREGEDQDEGRDQVEVVAEDQPDQEEAEEQKDEEKEELERAKQEMETRVYRLVTPIFSKTSKDTTAATMDMILRLRADGYHIGSIHADQGHEFYGTFRKWCRERGIFVSRTSGDDYKGNGRCEVAVKSLKTQIRRVLLGAEADSSWWPWAARWVNEANRACRIDKPIDFPPFLKEVTVRKRRWNQEVFEASTEKVKYLCPAPDLHGHWIVKGDEAPRVTKLLLKPTQHPASNEDWIALENEVPDPLERRRRLREKASVRRLEGGLKTEEQEREEQEEIRRNRLRCIIEEEMHLLLTDSTSLAMEEMKILAALKKQIKDEVKEEEEEVLQTKIVSPKEVSLMWSEWKEAAMSEINALLTDKEMTREEVRRLEEKAGKEGRKVEVIPSKIVATRKPGPNGGKKKIRWVVCGNLEPVKDKEETFSSGADAAAFRVLIWTSCRNQWQAKVLDVRTAFLNAMMELAEDEDYLIVRPPPLFVEKKIYPPDHRFWPLKAVYGFRRSPRLWGKCRDRTLEDIRIQVMVGATSLTLKLVPLDSEPNLWRILNSEQPEDSTLYGLLMTYVDDLFVASNSEVLEATVKRIQEIWLVSKPEDVGLHPTRFLGMEVAKRPEGEGGRESWYLTQTSYTKDLLSKVEFPVKGRKIPITRDQSLMESQTEEVTPESIKESQKNIGEALWLTTRTRPDLAYTVSRMGSSATVPLLRKPQILFKKSSSRWPGIFTTPKTKA